MRVYAADRPAEPGSVSMTQRARNSPFSSIRLIFRPFGNTRPPDWQLLVAEPDITISSESASDDRLTSLLENRYQPLKGTSQTNILFRLDDPRSISSWYMEYIFLNVGRCDTFGFYRLIFQQALVAFRSLLFRVVHGILIGIKRGG